ncbi:EAL domain-containing protein (putative c-di-GMP-specific phosphodiesterase class I) [Paraburkholderia sp. WC7.3g]|uniref:hypothetical protein n=1 Tax=Paraburkholderia sp. WC7.3g TaxID=2991070 RepID=UPI003D243713
MKPSDPLQLGGGNAPFLYSSARLGNLTLSSAFQPIFSLSHRRSIGYEALLRVRDPAGKEVHPLAVLDRTVERGRWNNLERSVQALAV